MKIRINHTSFMKIGLILILIAGNYWGIAQFTLRYNTRLFFLLLSGLLPLLLPLYYKKNKLIIPWVLCFLLIILNRNAEFARGGYYSSIRLIAGFLLIFASNKSYQWIKKAPHTIIAVGGANVIATLLFFFDSGIYKKFISMTYGQYQNGTLNGLYGYRAALAPHYSQNGTYIVMVALAVFTILIFSKKRSKLLFFFGVLSVIALLLTTKRAHLFFGLSSIMMCYYIANPGRRVEKSFKLMIAVAVGLFGLSFLMDFIPEISAVFDRFKTAGSDNASTARFIMWARAIQLFKKNPILGIGWFGFKYNSGLSDLTGAYAGCHNIYLELLCETGLIGFIVYMSAICISLYNTVKNLNMIYQREEYQDMRLALASSLAIQLFVIMYGLTGNPIYDDTFCFYAVAVAVNMSFSMGARRMEYV